MVGKIEGVATDGDNKMWFSRAEIKKFLYASSSPLKNKYRPSISKKSV